LGSRILRSVAVAAAAAAACTFLATSRANPIAADEAAPLATPGASMPLATPARGNLAQERADAMAAARDPALLPIDMQGVGTQAHPAPSALPRTPSGDPGNGDDALKRFATSARDWMHDVFGRPDNPQDNAANGLPGAPGAPGELGLPVETQASGVQAMAQRAQRSIEVPPPGAGPHRATAAAAPPRESAGARMLADSAPEYSIQRFLRRCREVLVHPMTWLAIVGIGIAHIAMNRRRR
jgi:hypothetical protein